LEKPVREMINELDIGQWVTIVIMVVRQYCYGEYVSGGPCREMTVKRTCCLPCLPAGLTPVATVCLSVEGVVWVCERA
jgi:hypothetical protein